MNGAKKNVVSDSSEFWCRFKHKYVFFFVCTCKYLFSMHILQRVLNYKFELSCFWQSFSMFCSEMWHHLLDSPVITAYDQVTNFLFLCIWKTVVRKLRIVFSDQKESEFQLSLRSVYKLMNMLIILQTNSNKLQIHTYCDTWTTLLNDNKL